MRAHPNRYCLLLISTKRVTKRTAFNRYPNEYTAYYLKQVEVYPIGPEDLQLGEISLSPQHVNVSASRNVYIHVCNRGIKLILVQWEVAESGR